MTPRPRPFGRAPAVVGIALSLGLLACGPDPNGSGEPLTPTPTSKAPRHLVLVTIDTLRADRIGAWGDAEARTPTLDRLAAEGLRLEQAIAPVPLTLPSHSVMMTGRTARELGVRVNGFDHLAAEHRTLAEILAERGWDTAAVVASYVLTSKFGLDQGFATYDDRLGAGHLGESQFESEIPANRVNDKVRAWLGGRRADDDRSVFLWVHYYDPHLPYAPPPTAPPGVDPYRGEIAFVDTQLAKLLEMLEDGGLGDALLVVTSDHGEAFSEHGEEGHGLLTYQETMAVPLLFHHPPSIEPGIVAERRGLIDLAPTVLDLLGLPPSPEMSGRALDTEGSPIEFESLAGQRLEGWTPIHGIVDEDLKLIAYRQDPELFDLAQDPHESHDLAGERRGDVRRLLQTLEGALASSEATADTAGAGLDAEDREHLEALGYLGSGATAPGGSLIDPRLGMVVETALRKVRTQLQAGNRALALKLLVDLERREPDVRTPDHFELRADLVDDPAEGLEVLARGVERFPDYFPLRFTFASRLFAAGRLDEAEAQGRRLVEDPRRSEAWNLLGQIAERRGDPRGAAEAYRQAATIEVGSVQFRLRAADALARAGDAAAALGLYEETLRDGFVEDAGVFLRAALLARQLEETERAEEFFLRGLDARPDALYRLSWGVFLAHQNRNDEALEQFHLALADGLEEPARSMARAMIQRLESGQGSIGVPTP